MTKIINFTATEILPKLLTREKDQTIRPAWKTWIDTEAYINNFVRKGQPIKPSRFKVGDKIKLMWCQRSKYKLFCKTCGGYVFMKKEISEDYQTLWCETCNHLAVGKLSLIPNEETERKLKIMTFHKILGEGEINELFDIEMWKRDNKYFIADKMRGQWTRKLIEDLSKRDGFKDSESMFKYFDKNHDLSNPKIFEVRRWIWK